MDLSNVKPFQIIILTVFSVLAVGGLIIFANFGGFSGSSNAIGSVTIWGTLPQSAVGESVNALVANNQNYKGVVYVEKQADTFGETLAEALAEGTGPDLVLISQEQLASEQNKLIVIPFSTISERDFLDSYLPITEIFLATEGTYGIPFVVDPLVLYYNRTLLSNAGIPSVPTSWEAITSLAEQLTVRGAVGITTSVIPLGAYENVENARALLSLLLLQAGNPIVSVNERGPRAVLADGDPSAFGVIPSESALRFYTQFADPAKTVYTWNRALPTARQSFIAGDLIFYPGFASELSLLSASNPNLDFDMTAIPQPQTVATKLTYARAHAFAIPRASKNPTGALTVALELAGSQYATIAASMLSMAPATRASLIPNASDRFQPVYFPQALISRGWLSPAPADTDRAFSTMIGNITSGRSDIGKALTTADQAIDASF